MPKVPKLVVRTDFAPEPKKTVFNCFMTPLAKDPHKRISRRGL